MKPAGMRYDFCRHRPAVPAIPYLGVRTKGVRRPSTPDSTAEALLNEMPIPTARATGIPRARRQSPCPSPSGCSRSKRLWEKA